MGCREAVTILFIRLAASALQFTNAGTHVPLTPAFQVPQAVFAESGVTVAVAVSTDEAGRTWVIGTFTPHEPKFHLYSKDLPTTGIRGVGRPTRVDVIPSAAIALDGPLVANSPVRRLHVEPLDQELPVYPDGAVTLRQPVRVSVVPSDSVTLVELSISYMACSKNLCLPAVVDRHVEIAIPREARR